MNIQKRSLVMWLSLISLSLLYGCAVAPQKKAIHLDSNYKAPEIAEIILLPAVDARDDYEVELDVQDTVLTWTKHLLKERGYKVKASALREDAGPITKDDCKLGKASWIKELGPSNARWIMVIFLDDLFSKPTFGGTASAEVSGFLFDKQTGIVVWRDKGIGRTGQAGVFGMMMKGLMPEEAVLLAIQNLVSSIPIRSS